MKILPLVLLLFLTASPVGAEEFGNWFTETKSEKVLYAATVNDNGSLLGQFCYLGGGSCLWLIGMDTSCNKGDEYTVLANSDTGAVSLKVLCDGPLENKSYRYVFSDFAAIDKVVKTGKRIGFAVPLQSDEFRVVRFPLNGAKPAIAIMRSVAVKKTDPRSGRGKDEMI